MTTDVHLSRVEGEFQEYDYPMDREALADACSGTTVLFVDGDA